MSSENTPLLPTKKQQREFSISRKVGLTITFTIVFIIVFISSFFIQNDKMNINGPSIHLKIYTNNIRFDNKNHPDKNEQPWAVRKIQSINSMRFNTFLGNANVICLQEVLHNQLIDILNGLNEFEEWDYYGVGRTDGKTAGEYAPILYKKKDFNVLDTKTFWLSPTPDVPSKGWDAALERIATMVTFQSKANPLIKFNVFNTHYDHIGVVARHKSTELIITKLNVNEYPSFLAGDLNTEPTDEPYSILKNSGWKDSHEFIDKKYSYGFNDTFTGFSGEASTRIDYVWSPSYTKSFSGVNQKSNASEYFDVTLEQFGVLSNWFDGHYFSDHRPVSATYEISRSKILL